MESHTFVQPQWVRRLTVAFALATALAACGSETAASTSDVATTGVPSQTTVAVEPAPTTTVPIETTAAPTTTAAPQTTVAPTDDRIVLLESFLDAYNRGDNEAALPMLSTEFREAQNYGAPFLTNEQWYSWFSQYEWIQTSLECAVVEDQAVCEEIGDDKFSRALGYRAKATWIATVENGQIADLQLQPTDGAVWGVFFPWLAATYPDEVGCSANSTHVDAWDLWVDECIELQMSKVDEYAASGSYSAPPAVD